MNDKLPPGSHCRICGSMRLNRSHFTDNLTNKIGFYRILVNDNSIDQLIRPCDCRGDFAFAHKICLSDWIETTKHQFCDICRFRYNVSIYERSIFEWISETQQVERIFRMVCVSTLIYYTSSLGVLNFMSRQTNNMLSIMVFTTACIWGLFCTIAIGIYTFWLFKEFIDWRLANRRVFVEENKCPQLDCQSKPKDVLKTSGFKPK